MYRPIVGKTLKHASYVALVLFVYVLQTTVFVYLPILGEKPLLLPLAVTAIAVTEGCEPGAAYGILCGLLCDVSHNQPTVMFTLALTVIGALTGYMCQRYLEEGILSCVVCAAAVLILSAAVQMFPLWAYRHAGAVPLAATAAVQTVYSLPFIVPMYYLCRVIKRIPDALRNNV